MLARVLPTIPIDVRPVAGGGGPAALYLNSLAPGSRPTMISALDRIAVFFGSTRDALHWHELRYRDTQALRSWLLEAYAPATANRHRAALRGVLKQALQLELIPEPDYRRAIDFDPIRGERPLRGREVPQGELRALFYEAGLTPASVARNTALLAVLYAGGLRRSEAVNLDLEHVDNQGPSGAPASRLTVRGKGDKVRLVYLGAAASSAVAAWLEVRGDVAGPLFYAVTKMGKIEPTHRLRPETVRNILLRVLKAADVPHLSPHDLRRTFVGDLLDAGADLSTVQGLAGHAQASTTARYDRRGERAKRGAAELLTIPYS